MLGAPALTSSTVDAKRLGRTSPIIWQQRFELWSRADRLLVESQQAALVLIQQVLHMQALQRLAFMLGIVHAISQLAEVTRRYFRLPNIRSLDVYGSFEPVNSLKISILHLDRAISNMLNVRFCVSSVNYRQPIRSPGNYIQATAQIFLRKELWTQSSRFGESTELQTKISEHQEDEVAGTSCLRVIFLTRIQPARST